jgi:hypothetical protein
LGDTQGQGLALFQGGEHGPVLLGAPGCCPHAAALRVGDAPPPLEEGEAGWLQLAPHAAPAATWRRSMALATAMAL